MTSYIREAATTSELLKRNDVDAVEIHTTGRYSFLIEGRTFTISWMFCAFNLIEFISIQVEAIPLY